MAMSEKPLLTDVAVEERTSPCEIEVSKQHNSHGLSEQDVTGHRETWCYNQMEEKKRDKCLEFLKHFGGSMPIVT